MKFELDADQVRKLSEWMDKKIPQYCGAIGGRFTYSFTPTSIGTVVTVTDSLAKEDDPTAKLDISDFD